MNFFNKREFADQHILILMVINFYLKTIEKRLTHIALDFTHLLKIQIKLSLISQQSHFLQKKKPLLQSKGLTAENHKNDQ